MFHLCGGVVSLQLKDRKFPYLQRDVILTRHYKHQGIKSGRTCRTGGGKGTFAPYTYVIFFSVNLPGKSIHHQTTSHHTSIVNRWLHGCWQSTIMESSDMVTHVLTVNSFPDHSAQEGKRMACFFFRFNTFLVICNAIFLLSWFLVPPIDSMYYLYIYKLFKRLNLHLS